MAASAVTTDVVIPRKRFYLSVIDPLLEDPVFWEITKPYTVVGFAEGHGVDFIIPWRNMGIDVMEESKKLDPWFNPIYKAMMDRAGFLHDPELQILGANSDKSLEGRDDAYFSLCAERHEDGDFSWWIGSKRADFSFKSIPLAPMSDRLKKTDEATGEKRWKVNNAFKFVWNEANLGYYKMAPSQKFRFCVLDMEKEKEEELAADLQRKLKTEENSEQEEHGVELTSLPEAVLGRIAGFCSPSELFSTLVLTSQYFTDVLKGHVSWEYVELNESYDSLRAAVFASAEEVRTLVCRELWDMHTREDTWNVWKRLASGESLRKLVVADLDMLIGVKIGEGLKEFGVCGAYLHSSEFSAVRFPSTVETVTVQLYRLGMPLPELQFDFLPSFPNAHTFKFDPCPSVDFWNQCRQEDLFRIKTLEVTFRPGSDVPLFRLKNLETLRVNNGTGPLHVEDLLRDSHLQHLTTFAVEKLGLNCNSERKKRFWGVLARAAPSVKLLDVGCKGFDATCLDGILTCLPGLQHLLVQDCSVTVNKIGEYLASATNILFARITTSTPGVPKQNEYKIFDMLQHLAPGAFYWQWASSGNDRLKLTVVFTRGYVFPKAFHDWQKML